MKPLRVAFRIRGADQRPAVIIPVTADIAGTVFLPYQLTTLIPPETVRVVQGIRALEQIPLQVPGKLRLAAFRIDQGDHIPGPVNLSFLLFTEFFSVL